MNLSSKIKIFSIFILLAAIGSLWLVSNSGAFSGPSSQPGPTSQGALRYNAATGYFGIGIDPDASARLLIKGGTGVSGLKILNSAGTPVLDVTEDTVKIGNPSESLYVYGPAALKATSIRASSAYIGDIYVTNARVYGDIIGLGANPKIEGFKTISADNIIGTFEASNISPGVFGVGDYAFDVGSKVGVSYSSVLLPDARLSVNGNAYFANNVGIGGAGIPSDPGALNITASTLWLNGFNKGIRLEGNSSIEFNGGGTTLYGIGADPTSNRLYVFNTNTEQGTTPNFYNLTLNTSGVGIGIGATNPGATLHVSGTLKISGGSGFQFSTSSMGVGKVLTSDASGNATWADGGSITGGAQDNTARHNGTSWEASNFLVNTGLGVGVGTAPITGTYLQVGSNGYFQIDKYFPSSAPTPSDCDDNTERGRLTYGTVGSDNFFYVCMGSASWKAVKLTN